MSTCLCVVQRVYCACLCLCAPPEIKKMPSVEWIVIAVLVILSLVAASIMCLCRVPRIPPWVHVGDDNDLEWAIEEEIRRMRDRNAMEHEELDRAVAW